MALISLPFLRRTSKGFVPGTIILLALFALFHYLPGSPTSSSPVRPTINDVSYDSPFSPPRAAYDGSNPFLPLDANGAPIPFEHPSKSRVKLPPPRLVTNAASLAHPVLPPDFPDPATLPPPSDFARFLEMGGRKVWEGKRPNVTVFPDELLKRIRPEGVERGELARAGNWTAEHGTFAREWEDGDKVEGMKEMPRVQFQDWGVEDAEHKRVREGRRDVVKGAFLHAWESYKSHAWQHDEIRPVSGTPSNPFMGWGASVIDTLDTLLILGLPQEFAYARQHVREVDFGIISGLDWGRNGERSGRTVVSIHAFETVIRYMGGLLGAYDLSGDKLMLDRAEEVGKIILPIFDTSSGVPMSRLNPANPKQILGGHSIQLAEAGTLALEYTRLSQLTGNKTYFELAHRGMAFLDAEVSKQSPYQPLIPTVFNTEKYKGGIMGTFSFGGTADSYYEYLVKLHVLLRGSRPMYAKMYRNAIDTAKRELFKKVSVVPGKPDLLTPGEIKSGRYQYALEHLSCFIGGTLALGAKLLDRPNDLVVGQKISQTCYFVGSSTVTGLQPERADFWLPDDPKRYERLEDKDTQEVFTVTKGNPSGVKAMHRHYISRPESIESVFYLYRITGDRRYQDQGWRMFTSWLRASTTPLAFSSTTDVRQSPPVPRDNMESFVFAETFKYYYLLFCSPDHLSLDEYVLSTEAHPFIHSPGMKPGASGWWDAEKYEDENEEGKRGEGTGTQKWAVYKERKDWGMLFGLDAEGKEVVEQEEEEVVGKVEEGETVQVVEGYEPAEVTKARGTGAVDPMAKEDPFAIPPPKKEEEHV